MRVVLILMTALLLLGCTDRPDCEGDNVNKCYENMAIIYRDASICQNVTDDCGYPQGCPNMLQCYYNVGLSGKDIGICEKALTQEYKYTCYSGVGIGTQDISICYMIPDNEESSRTRCMDGITPFR